MGRLRGIAAESITFILGCCAGGRGLKNSNLQHQNYVCSGTLGRLILLLNTQNTGERKESTDTAPSILLSFSSPKMFCMCNCNHVSVQSVWALTPHCCLIIRHKSLKCNLALHNQIICHCTMKSRLCGL